jgi:hypothetical protein
MPYCCSTYKSYTQKTPFSFKSQLSILYLCLGFRNGDEIRNILAFFQTTQEYEYTNYNTNDFVSTHNPSTIIKLCNIHTMIIYSSLIASCLSDSIN